MRLKVGNLEAHRLRNRIATTELTQKQLADKINVSERYIREILSTKKTKDIHVDQQKVEEILALLGIGLNQVFTHKTQSHLLSHPVLDTYVKTLKSKMYGILSKDASETGHSQQLAHYLQEDKAVNKTMGFWYTLIIKTIADKYKVMHDFFEKNEFFTIIPESGYWRKFRHDASQQKNCYFSFKLVPKVKNATFHIAYTLESPINIGSIIPNKIKIIYGKIEQLDDCIIVTQHYDTPGSYKIKPSNEIIVTTWLDESNHDFIITSNHDFGLYTENTNNNEYKLGESTKESVSLLFHNLGTALFPRNHIFHREGKYDMGDDPIFFWSNSNFMKSNNHYMK